VTPEGYEKSKVKKFLSQIGAYQFWPVQTGYGAATLDCLACVGGRFVGIEVKRAGYHPSNFTARQRATINAILGAHGMVARGSGEEIIKELAAWLLKQHTAQNDSQKSVRAAGK
jgi:hypothetical protein